MTELPINPTSFFPSDSPEKLFGHLLMGRYRITGFVGQSASGRVYAGWDGNLKRQVAIKIPTPEAARDQEYMGRFEKEAMTMARFQHENIVAVYDYCVAHNILEVNFIAMEFVTGDAITDFVLQHETNLSVRDVVELIRQIAGGVDAAHAEGVLHRDLRPTNIRITKARKIPKVLDFGVAKFERADDEEEAEGAASFERVPFDPRYGAPEQWRAAYTPPEKLAENPIDIGPAADQYAFGMMLYELLARSHPFDCKSTLEWGLAHRRMDPIALRRRNRNWPAELEAAVMRAIAKDPADRFPSLAALIEEIEEALIAERKKLFAEFFPAEGAAIVGGLDLPEEPPAPPPPAIEDRESEEEGVDRTAEFTPPPSLVSQLAASALPEPSDPAESPPSDERQTVEVQRPEPSPEPPPAPAPEVQPRPEPSPAPVAAPIVPRTQPVAQPAPQPAQPARGPIWNVWSIVGVAAVLALAAVAIVAVIMLAGTGSGPSPEIIAEGGFETSVEPIPVTVIFPERIETFDPSFLDIRNADYVNFRPGTGTNAWAFDLQPKGAPGQPRRVEGITVRVRNVPLEGGGKPTEEVTSPEFVFDSEPPTVEVRLSGGVGGGLVAGDSVRLTLQLSEPCPDLQLSSIEVEGAQVSGLRPMPPGNGYEVTLQPRPVNPGVSSRPVTVKVSGVRDSVGNVMVGTAEFAFEYDSQPPSIEVASPALQAMPGQAARTTTQLIPIVVTVSEPLARPMLAEDLSVSGGVIDNWAATNEEATRYEAVVYASSPGAVSISVPGGRICDVAGNCAPASRGFGWVYEGPAATPTPTPTPTPIPTAAPVAEDPNDAPLVPSGTRVRRSPREVPRR